MANKEKRFLVGLDLLADGMDDGSLEFSAETEFLGVDLCEVFRGGIGVVEVPLKLVF